MVFNSIFRFIIFCILSQFGVASLSAMPNIELFSFSYSEEGDCKLNVLYNPVYDEQAIKKEIEDIKKLEEETAANKQKIAETLQEKLQLQQKEVEAGLLYKKTEENIKLQKAALHKILSEL